MRTLYRAAAVHTPASTADPAAGDGAAGALLVDGAAVAWVGPADDADPDVADAVVDLPGAVLAPAFVDAHAHVTETGLLLRGVDLQGVRTLTDLLDRVAAGARTGTGTVLGHGWDETLLAEGRPPTATELDRAAGGAAVYLSRVDVHSAVISTRLATASGAPARDGWDPSGRVERDAHHAARDRTRTGLTPADRRAAQLAALHAAATAGIAAVHEMSAPHIASEQDLAQLLALSADAGERLPRVVAYRGELVATVEQAEARLAALPGPIAGLAGDLCVDGSVGSRTAAFHDPYADAPQSRGHLYLDADQVRDHVEACTRAGVQAGFHVIGDAAVDAALRGIRRAAERVGIAAVRAARHRLEHLEALGARQVAEVADLGLTASVQPAFDAAWGGGSGMYAERLGAARALGMNPFAGLAAAGVRLALGSDSPVTPFDPWGAVHAAVRHHVPEHRIPAPVAFLAHTRGGWQAAGRMAADASGTLAMGAPATFAAWSLAAGDPLADLVRPQCLLTVLDGRVLYDPEGLAGPVAG